MRWGFRVEKANKVPIRKIWLASDSPVAIQWNQCGCNAHAQCITSPHECEENPRCPGRTGPQRMDGAQGHAASFLQIDRGEGRSVWCHQAQRCYGRKRSSSAVDSSNRPGRYSPGSKWETFNRRACPVRQDRYSRFLAACKLCRIAAVSILEE
jgi:hypothetical protein